MARTNQVHAWVLGLALLAGGEFSYAHLRRLGLWPLELMARSMWRLASVAAGTTFPAGALWIGAVAFIVLLGWGLVTWKDRRRASTVGPTGGDHD